jgi:endoglycosylceramidase
MLRLAALAAVLGVLLATPPATAGRLASDGRWIRDNKGRVILLRGLNYSGLEFGRFIGNPLGPEEADFAQMASWGVNVVRLPVAWHYLEPAPGVFDVDHLRRQVDPIVTWAKRHGMRVILELHQFNWSPCTGGLGMPAWSCEGQGYSRDIVGAWTAQHDFWAGALGPDGRPLVEHFLDVWARLVARYRRSQAVAGFDFLNEPLDIQALDTFEHDTLYPFYRRAIALVRSARARQMIVLEPPVTRNLGIPAQPEPVGDDNLVWAPHLYTITGGLDTVPYNGDRAAIDADYELAAAEAAAQGAALWPGEFGGAVDRFPAETTLFWQHTMEELDERLLGGAGWAYFPGGNIFSVVDAEGREKPGVVDALVRPYPMQTAGIPQSIHWDGSVTGAFTYTFAEDPDRRIADPTVIFVPARHFPGGVVVETTPGDRAKVKLEDQRVLVRRDRRRALHTVTIMPATAGAAAPQAQRRARGG